MRILFDGAEYQVSGIPAKGNDYINGKAWCCNGSLIEGVKDITKYETVIDEDGNKIQVEIVPEVELDPSLD